MPWNRRIPGLFCFQPYSVNVMANNKGVNMSKVIALSKGQATVVDDEDFDYLSRFPWNCSGSGYAHCTLGGRKDRKGVFLHRLVMNAPPDKEVDHINGDRLDNRKCNLRLASRAENARNQKRKVMGSSQYKGVRILKHSGRWNAGVMKDYKHVTCGTFTSEQVAAVAYDYHAKRLFGQYASCNFTDDVFTALWEAYKDAILSPKRREGNSRYVGVYYSKRDRVWRAQVAVNKGSVSVGTFTSEEEAARAREPVARQLGGRLNFPDAA